MPSTWIGSPVAVLAGSLLQKTGPSCPAGCFLFMFLGEGSDSFQVNRNRMPFLFSMAFSACELLLLQLVWGLPKTGGRSFCSNGPWASEGSIACRHYQGTKRAPKPEAGTLPLEGINFFRDNPKSKLGVVCHPPLRCTVGISPLPIPSKAQPLCCPKIHKEGSFWGKKDLFCTGSILSFGANDVGEALPAPLSSAAMCLGSRMEVARSVKGYLEIHATQLGGWMGNCLAPKSVTASGFRRQGPFRATAII